MQSENSGKCTKAKITRKLENVTAWESRDGLKLA